MNAPEMIVLPDTQSLPDARALPIQKVGIKSLRYPIALRTASGNVQHTVAEFSNEHAAFYLLSGLASGLTT